MSATHADLVACVERELKLRIRVYPRWVLARRISQEKADAEIRMMGEVLKFLKEHAPAPMPPPQRDLFGGGE